MSRSVSAPSSVTKTSPCWNGFIVPGSTFRYGSSFCIVTRSPRAVSRLPRLLAVSPLPSEEATPPVTNTCLVCLTDCTKEGSRGRAAALGVGVAGRSRAGWARDPRESTVTRRAAGTPSARRAGSSPPCRGTAYPPFARRAGTTTPAHRAGHRPPAPDAARPPPSCGAPDSGGRGGRERRLRRGGRAVLPGTAAALLGQGEDGGDPAGRGVRVVDGGDRAGQPRVGAHDADQPVRAGGAGGPGDQRTLAATVQRGGKLAERLHPVRDAGAPHRLGGDQHRVVTRADLATLGAQHLQAGEPGQHLAHRRLVRAGATGPAADQHVGQQRPAQHHRVVTLRKLEPGRLPAA